MHFNSKRFILGGLFLAVFAFFAIQAADYALFALSPLKNGSSDSAIIEVHKGQGPRDVSHALRNGGILASSSEEQKFLWTGRVLRQWRKIKAGEYQLSPKMTPLEIFSVLASGISVARPFTVIEGENMYEIAQALEKKGLASKERFIELCKDPKFITALGFNPAKTVSLEGFLYPNTYLFNKTVSMEDMIRQMIKQYHAVWGEKEEQRAKELGLSQYELITLASIVEKETGAAQERPLIASVFFNRLKKKMRLQSDPTTIYGIWERYTGNLHKSDLLDANPYNTYHVPALPLGPIANPGKEAIQAALYPTPSEFLYFVSQNDGTHQFSRTLEEHNSAVQRYQMNPNARKGKSWRDLKAAKN